ncbi:hypothetical protein K0M31_000436 [Melipona bicolor]|uniref:Uncharacterized protein n=1 Tax=Melipona bicolor TaxID=60889 RepID=A0AA40GEB8_9HYME|nr:hypothetical protein K0M31_000436 [Melipona bicolor]
MEGQTNGPSVFAIQVMATEGPLLVGSTLDSHGQGWPCREWACKQASRDPMSEDYRLFLPQYRKFHINFQRSNLLRTTTPYRLSRSCSKKRLPSAADSGRRARRKNDDSSGIKSKLSLKPESLKERETGNTGETEMTGQGSKYDGEKRENDRLVGCSRRSNFQNGSSSIKQVLLSPVQPERPTEPNSSRNVQRIPP